MTDKRAEHRRHNRAVDKFLEAQALRARPQFRNAPIFPRRVPLSEQRGTLAYKEAHTQAFRRYMNTLVSMWRP